MDKRDSPCSLASWLDDEPGLWSGDNELEARAGNGALRRVWSNGMNTACAHKDSGVGSLMGWCWACWGGASWGGVGVVGW